MGLVPIDFNVWIFEKKRGMEFQVDLNFTLCEENRESKCHGYYLSNSYVK